MKKKTKKKGEEEESETVDNPTIDSETASKEDEKILSTSVSPYPPNQTVKGNFMVVHIQTNKDHKRRDFIGKVFNILGGLEQEDERSKCTIKL